MKQPTTSRTTDSDNPGWLRRLVRGHNHVTLYNADCLTLLPDIVCDAVITDPPFSARTHSGHDAFAAEHAGEGNDGAARSGLGYAAWTAEEVRAVCGNLPPKGWCCFITDHVLAREWERELLAVGRYVFAPVPCVTKGRSVRLSGDGPSSWTDWLIVSRTAKEARWGTLPGIYEGSVGSIAHMGGKPLNVLCRIVEDYTRVGDTVLDLCMGSGTTGIACLRTNRNFIGIEKDLEHFKTACARLERECNQGALL